MVLDILAVQARLEGRFCKWLFPCYHDKIMEYCFGDFLGTLVVFAVIEAPEKINYKRSWLNEINTLPLGVAIN